MDPLALETLMQLAYAVGIGTLIGLERSLDSEHSLGPEGDEPGRTDADSPYEEVPPGETPGEQRELVGVRTFIMLALVGYVSALLGQQFTLVAAVALLVVGLVVVTLYLRFSSVRAGITTEVAAVATCALGQLCLSHRGLAAVIAVVMTAVLASKRATHRTVAHMRRVELIDTLKFLVVILIVLPLLPDEPLDPYGALNPYTVGLLVVLISGLGFVGYFLTRVLGPSRGLTLTGVIGGLSSSTAVTVAMARHARQRPDWSPFCVSATLAANAVMFVRVLFVVGVFDISLSLQLAWTVGSMAVAMAAVMVWIGWRAQRRPPTTQDSEEMKLRNPFSLGPAAQFAALFVGIRFLLELLRRSLGDQGIYLAAGLSGLADVDAISLSVAEQVSSEAMPRHVAAVAITMAVAANSVTKTGIALWMGGGRFGRLTGAGLAGATLAGGLVGWVAWALTG